MRRNGLGASVRLHHGGRKQNMLAYVPVGNKREMPYGKNSCDGRTAGARSGRGGTTSPEKGLGLTLAFSKGRGISGLGSQLRTGQAMYMTVISSNRPPVEDRFGGTTKSGSRRRAFHAM